MVGFVLAAYQCETIIYRNRLVIQHPHAAVRKCRNQLVHRPRVGIMVSQGSVDAEFGLHLLENTAKPPFDKSIQVIVDNIPGIQNQIGIQGIDFLDHPFCVASAGQQAEMHV
ncbi:hypothetical protein D3C75_1108270 [compost metagenome]